MITPSTRTRPQISKGDKVKADTGLRGKALFEVTRGQWSVGYKTDDGKERSETFSESQLTKIQ